MFHALKMMALIVLVGLCAGCQTTAEPYEDDWELKYQHSAEFMWDQVQYALGKNFSIAEKDFEKREIVTDWNEHLSVMSHHGYRERLIVNLEGDDSEGFTVKVKEEKEINTEQVNPQSSSEAEWEESDADGGASSKFRVALHRRLHPKETWKEESVR